MNEPKTVAFKTLGCRLNLYETDALAAEFVRKNYKIVDFGEPADLYVINTCTVTNQSDQKSRREINVAHKANAHGVTIITGCMATNYKEQLEKNEAIDYVVDNQHKTSVLAVAEAHFNGELVDINHFDANLFNYSPADTTFHTRSLIKIQDGCDNFCTFCIIPKVRGRATSRPPEDIFENIKTVIAYGYKEIVLTGVNLGRYQHGAYDFERLTEEILEIPGDFRVRISSIEPDGYSESFFRLFKHPKLTPHLHICLQSGSEEILLKMRRMYTARFFKDMALKLQQMHPGFNLTTDIIVGFPGETDDQFGETLEMMKAIGFGHVHTFKYSVRKGTRAERMEGQVAGHVKTRRSEEVRKLADAMKLSYRTSFIGTTQRVLVEKIRDDGTASGYGEHYIPVVIREHGLTANTFYDVTIEDILAGDEPTLTGTRVVETN